MWEGLFQPMHLMVTLAIVLIVFGPGKLPEVGAALGEAIRNLKKALNDVNDDATPSRTRTEKVETSADQRTHTTPD